MREVDEVVRGLDAGRSLGEALRRAGVPVRRIRWTREMVLDVGRRLALGESVPEVASQIGITRQKLHQILQRPNPLGLVKRWDCRACGHSWENTSRDFPKRCQRCRSGAWRTQGA